MDEPASTGESEGFIFLGFFYQLRAQGLKVTPTQWLTLIEGISKGLHGASLIGFYSLARSILIKDESEADTFDQVFAAHFKGAESAAAKIEDEVFQWLDNPAVPVHTDPQWRDLLDFVDVEALRREFEERLRTQKERHDGGSHWIGTRGTSPFGHSGHHPGGIRVGGRRGSGSAVQVAAERRFREHRRDRTLDTRQLGVALKKLRSLERRGAAEELDVEATIDKTARNGGELELVLAPPRENRIRLLMAMDVGGSMEPFRGLVERLFSAAHGIHHFKSFAHVYFHNCVYTHVYEDSIFDKPIALMDLFQRFDRETRLVLVGDAHMYPGELTDAYGAIHWNERNEKPGLFYLDQLRQHFKHTAWLNPIPQTYWMASSIRLVRQLFDMYPLTVEGVERLSKSLSQAG